MKYVATIQRNAYFSKVKQTNGTSEDATIGILEIKSPEGVIIWRCFTLENGGDSTDKSGQDKRIIARDYNLRWTSSNTNKALAKKYPKWARKSVRGDELVKDGTTGEAIAIWLTTDEIQGFNQRRILIHSGNESSHTNGCILLGNKNNKNGTIGDSVDCVREFFAKIAEIGIKNVILRIKEMK